ncbi:MAG: bestrophin family protein [Bacteroidia bacterium]|nr:bestrophin family protein [Bacteroidia bacterium]
MTAHKELRTRGTYDSKNWFAFLMTLQGSLLERLYPSLIIMGFVTTIFCVLQFVYQVIQIRISLQLHGLVGVILGLLLVFRTNTAYDRWWEGRRVLGIMLNTSRNLALLLHSFLPQNDLERRTRFVTLIATYFFACKEHLRNGVQADDLQLLPENDQQFILASRHRPNQVMRLLVQEAVDLYQQKIIDTVQLSLLTRHTTELTDCLGGCERIRNTPIPLAYAVLLKRFIFLYVTTLPFGLIHDLQWGAIPAVLVVFYVMVSIEMIGEEIEDPFGKDENDLPVDDIAERIQQNVSEILTS